VSGFPVGFRWYTRATKVSGPLERNALHDFWARRARERGETADRVVEPLVGEPLLAFEPVVPVNSRCSRWLVADWPHAKGENSQCRHCGVPVYDPKDYEVMLADQSAADEAAAE
jgi:hypothetical protein